MPKVLPIYEIKISADAESDLQVDAIALVKAPAIEKNWLAFDAQKNYLHFNEVKEDERIVIGAAMIPDLAIYRTDDKGNEFEVMFSKETISTIAQKFYSKGFQGNANLMHDGANPVTGVNYFLSWFKDEAKGMVGIEGDYPNGTWFIGAKIDNEEVWTKIKNGDIKGFSVEGLFAYEKMEIQTPTEDEELFAKIIYVLNEISE